VRKRTENKEINIKKIFKEILVCVWRKIQRKLKIDTRR
jgi:hypothetical protein